MCDVMSWKCQTKMGHEKYCCKEHRILTDKMDKPDCVEDKNYLEQ